MNKAILMGRFTGDPEIRHSQNENSTCIAKFTLAVDRRYKREGDPTADFIRCVAFGKTAEFAQKYFHKGSKALITGQIQTGSYTNKDGNKVYTTEVMVEEIEFAESKQAGNGNQQSAPPTQQATPPMPQQAAPQMYAQPQQPQYQQKPQQPVYQQAPPQPQYYQQMPQQAPQMPQATWTADSDFVSAAGAIKDGELPFD